MVQAIGSSASGAINATNPTNSAALAASLQAQLAIYQQQLSDCVNCASSKTIEGKEQIQSLSAKISGVRARIDQVSSTNANRQTVPSATNQDADIDPGKVLNISSGKENNSGTGAIASTANPHLGSNVDTLA
ncbi:FlxA-like family protein [Undibacterium sp. Jales W-56]|uniref:FlxA-like family protein n=1 Tax=Undibacterium sp. Jales W-56 TaxID=2897325 RepID=UPI0021D3312F|nr:FlxA-like family protein [Undibacterium sp. Jales W-56]MCU6433721.1 FlxA-like family protein [Undibacterium sp. Jales W-56]